MTKRPRFSAFVHFYLVSFLLALALLPLLAVSADGTPVESSHWGVALLWLVGLALVFWYANSSCSSGDSNYHDGLLWVTAFMMTGWAYLSLFVVLPALLVTFCGSVFIAASGDIRRDPDYAPVRWSRLVDFFSRHRMTP